MKADVTKYVALAFKQAGDLVKTLTITSIVRGEFSTTTGKYAEVATEYDVEAIDDEDDEIVTAASTHNKIMRKYLIKSATEMQVGQEFTDDGIEYTISRMKKIQQNSTIFVYSIWAIA